MDVAQIGAYLGAAFSIGVGAIGSAVGEGNIAGKTTHILFRQPNAQGKLFRNMLIAQAVTETTGIFALVVALLLVFQSPGVGIIKAVAYFSAGICMGLGAFGCAIGTGFGGAAACEGIGKQPANSDLITINMLVGQAVTQTTAIYALVISLILIFVI